MSLYLTPTRRALLSAVSAGRVSREGDHHDYLDGWQRVDARVAEATVAGWVRLSDRTHLIIGQLYVLTDAGRAVLAATAVTA